jgi:hypothetical protein
MGYPPVPSAEARQYPLSALFPNLLQEFAQPLRSSQAKEESGIQEAQTETPGSFAWSGIPLLTVPDSDANHAGILSIYLFHHPLIAASSSPPGQLTGKRRF